MAYWLWLGGQLSRGKMDRVSNVARSIVPRSNGGGQMSWTPRALCLHIVLANNNMQCTVRLCSVFVKNCAHDELLKLLGLYF